MSQHTGSVPDTERAAHWRDQALCSRREYADQIHIWFAPKTDAAAIRLARKICWDCPVLEACGRFAYETREPFGLWGAVSESERRAMLRRRGIRLPIAEEPETEQPKPAPKKRGIAKCGTPGGYSKHQRDKTEPCTACRAANAARQKTRRRTGFSRAAA